MINEEITKEALGHTEQAITMALRVTGQSKNLYQDIKDKISKDFGGIVATFKQGQRVQLKDEYKKGQLAEIQVSRHDLKEFKKELNRNGVKFSVMKDKQTNDHVVFFQGKDANIIDKAFKRAVAVVDQKENKPSVKKSIEQFKEMAKDTIKRDKVKVKNNERSL